MEIQYENDVTNAQEKMKGSDGRANVSARTDSRGYYNSRDKGQCYSLAWDHSAAAAGQYSFYIKNTSPTLTLVVRSVGMNADDLAKFKLWRVSGTAANGVAVVPYQMNSDSTNAADGTFLNDGGGTAITVGSADSLIDVVSLQLNGHEELRLDDMLRLGQNQAIALEADVVTSTPECFGVVFFYYE